MANQILKDDNEAKRPKYSRLFVTDPLTGIRQTILHLAALNDLVQIADHVIQLYPGLPYIQTSGGGASKCLPLELALTNRNDASAALLIRNMMNERYCLLYIHFFLKSEIKASF